MFKKVSELTNEEIQQWRNTLTVLKIVGVVITGVTFIGGILLDFREQQPEKLKELNL